MQEYFQHLNQYYDKIYVLSVEAAAERRELFAQRFKGLEYSFFFGADKNKFTIEETIEKNIFSEELDTETSPLWQNNEAWRNSLRLEP